MSGRTFKIFCRADEGYCVTVRNDDAVVLAPEDSRDAYQHWYKDMTHSSSVQDEEGRLAFALVNKATGLAIKHSRGQSHPVKLVPYEFDPEIVDESVLWTESKDVGDGFRCIRMVNNIYLNFDAYQGEGDDEEGGHDVHDGTPVVLWEWCEGENQSWKVLPWGCDPDEVSGNLGQPSEYDACFDAPPPPPSDLEVGHRGYDDPPADEGLHPALSSARTVRVLCSADEEYSLTLRNGAVCLAPSDDGDESQHWVKDMRHSTDVKDEEGYPAFALVNKVTGEAIKHSLGQSHPVGLKWYNPDNLDESVLWTQSADVGDGFRCIRMVNNILLNFDALGGVEDSTGIHDGTELVLWEWCEGDNQRWKILPW